MDLLRVSYTNIFLNYNRKLQDFHKYYYFPKSINEHHLKLDENCIHGA